MNNQHIQGYKFLWKIPQASKQQVQDIAQRYNLSIPLAQVLVNRGITQSEQVAEFLFTSREQLADSLLMKDIDTATQRILHAIEQKEKILIFGDYDVDGITSSSLMVMALLALGAKVNFFLPNRSRDGYGLSEKFVQKAADNKYAVIITVDNGITAFGPAQLAKKLGIDLIITDHHQPHEQVPEAFAIINPHQKDCRYPYKYFAGVGVAFKVIARLYETLGRQLPEKVLELLLLGTVADVVPLTGENRFWVRQGLTLINQKESLALRVLKSNSKLQKPYISSLDVGFSITPQINALGRLDDPRQGVQFLIGQNYGEVERIGGVLASLNQARKDIEQTIFKEVQHQIESGSINLEQENLIVAASKQWPAGVIGLVASRLVSAYGKPAILFHITKDGLAKGSCRSIPEFNMFAALQKHADILHSFGGHHAAAGLSLAVDDVPVLKRGIEALIAQELTEFDLQQKIAADACAQLGDFSGKFMKDIEYFEPFGHENSQPYFYISDVVLVQKPQLLKHEHVKCKIFADGVIKPLIFFRRPELFDILVGLGDTPFDVLAQVSENFWNGKTTIQLLGIDIARKENA